VKDLVTYIARQLIHKPQYLSVSDVQLDEKTVIQVQVAPEDLPRLIGDQGKIFRAFRNLVKLVGDQEQDIVVEIAP